MPKSTRVTKVDGVIRRQKVPMKLRIGTRKSGQSAMGMSSEELKSVLDVKDKSKWHPNAKAVLARRGIELN